MSSNVCIRPTLCPWRLGRLKLARVSPSVGLVGLADFCCGHTSPSLVMHHGPRRPCLGAIFSVMAPSTPNYSTLTSSLLTSFEPFDALASPHTSHTATLRSRGKFYGGRRSFHHRSHSFPPLPPRLLPTQRMASASLPLIALPSWWMMDRFNYASLRGCSRIHVHSNYSNDYDSPAHLTPSR